MKNYLEILNGNTTVYVKDGEKAYYCRGYDGKWHLSEYTWKEVIELYPEENSYCRVKPMTKDEYICELTMMELVS